jgi:uncharacterized protein (DUF1778 family)
MTNEVDRRTIEDTDVVRLSAEDQMRLAEALINPAAPNDALYRAKKLHTENVEVR